MPNAGLQHPTGRWKRTAAAALLLLAGGAVVNVAVAWGFSVLAKQPSPSVGDWLDGNQIENRPSWPAYLERLNWPPVEHTRSTRPRSTTPASLGITIIVRSGGNWQLNPRRSMMATDVEGIFVELEARRFGLPCRSLQWENPTTYTFVAMPDDTVDAVRMAGPRLGIDLSHRFGPQGRGETRRLPLTPIWPGFIINTLFYALLLWLLFLAPFAARRMLRRRRGLCETCAYPVGVSSVCTECGAAVPAGRR